MPKGVYPRKPGSQSGEHNNNYKGDKVGYHGLHAWIRAARGTPSLCEHCGVTDAKKYVWANVSRKYKRELDDWIRLCASCHAKYDMTDNWRQKNRINGKLGGITRGRNQTMALQNV